MKYIIDDIDKDLVSSGNVTVYQGNISFTTPHTEPDGTTTGLLLSRAIAYRKGIDLRKIVKHIDGDKTNLRRNNIRGAGRVFLSDGIILDEQYKSLLDDHPFVMTKEGYIRSSKSLEGCQDKKPYLHRYLWNIANGLIPSSMTIDHKNRQPLDNRLCNLRLADRFQQSLNRTNNTKSVGVQKMPNRNKAYHASARQRVGDKTKRVSLGYYYTEKEAAMARDKFYLETLSKEDLSFFVPNYL